MIGVYDYTVILTYLGLFSAVNGMMCALHGNLSTAVICLVISGVCDMFDGRVASTKKDRTMDQHIFGIQIDSLCDLVCFGVFPMIIAYAMGMTGMVGTIVAGVYILAAVIRLANYNVTEENRQRNQAEKRKSYQGLPVTTIAIIIPVYFELGKRFISFPHGTPLFPVPVLTGMILLIAIMFVLNVRIVKPNFKVLLGFAVIALLFVIHHLLKKAGVF